jgi:hypothetical protein
VPGGNAVADSQPQPQARAVVFGGKKRRAQLFQIILLDPFALVLYRQNRFISFHKRPDRSILPGGHCFQPIADHVEHQLADLFLVQQQAIDIFTALLY